MAQARPPSPCPALAPEEACKAECATRGHCCNAHLHQGSNQHLSCLQACMAKRERPLL
ncbi:hypothetical protein EMIHUDRAFT_251253 [Emiliania huxleyi CCMP1516]|uniref:Uncharacterized protein n=2 Tax=Emiliania huxleyi TaxID=2903 RepID=A0A0D3KWV1_EMIH1|nr:hypothetical protein EMIHUDRAFT_251253 [Emiliania huxleyi CCMP1516]EOD40236.1 hypothetical protein EMIHUDRAFT_251253 [Emiliania huxleyi CCMP1516]|eukprot:XP_005792665.1 hypothetical protein EMIHUDRAFT_251253 [Emiliania huxleyi CCMP1516]